MGRWEKGRERELRLECKVKKIKQIKKISLRNKVSPISFFKTFLDSMFHDFGHPDNG